MVNNKLKLKMYPKITLEEKELLTQYRILKIDSDKDYARDLFETYYKDNVETNLEQWTKLSKEDKIVIAEHINDQENKGFTSHAFKTHPINVNKAMMLISTLKNYQLKEWGIRK